MAGRSSQPGSCVVGLVEARLVVTGSGSPSLVEGSPSSVEGSPSSVEGPPSSVEGPPSSETLAGPSQFRDFNPVETAARFSGKAAYRASQNKRFKRGGRSRQWAARPMGGPANGRPIEPANGRPIEPAKTNALKRVVGPGNGRPGQWAAQPMGGQSSHLMGGQSSQPKKTL